jgi:2-oxoglutarate dehydrogenase E2 component (dihydrolipoamide succinyltransferase)
MLARTAFRSAAALAAPRRVPHHVTSILIQSRLHIRYASTTIKVPQMAESISEGTLKQFSKAVGDYVEADEEVATIETDKIDVAVTAPEAGTIKEILVKEEDTVTVGQELIILETGGDKPAEDSKSEAPKEEKPKEEKKEEPTASPPKEEKPPAPKEESKPAPPKQAPPPPPPQPKKTPALKPAEDDGKFKLWTRDERRVSCSPSTEAQIPHLILFIWLN